MKTRREWKACAKKALRGNYAIPVFASILVALVNFAGGYLTDMLFPGTSVATIILSQIFAFTLTLVICVFTTGLYYMYLNIARGLDYSFGDLTFFFKNQPDRVIMASLVLALIGWVTSLPASIYGYTENTAATEEEMLAFVSTYLLLNLLGLVLNIILTVPFTLTYYILADEMELSGMETLTRSLSLMKGRIGKYILLQLSFIPWLFVSMFTMYVALLWLIPYMQMTNVMFYRDILGKLDPPAQGRLDSNEIFSR